MLKPAKRCVYCKTLIKHQDSFCHNCLNPHEKYRGEPEYMKSFNDYAV